MTRRSESLEPAGQGQGVGDEAYTALAHSSAQ